MGELAKYDPMGIDEKERYVIRGRKILKEYYPRDTGTWTYHPPTPHEGWRYTYRPGFYNTTTTTSTTSNMSTTSDTSYSPTYDPESTLYRYGSIYRRADSVVPLRVQDLGGN